MSLKGCNVWADQWKVICENRGWRGELPDVGSLLGLNTAAADSTLQWPCSIILFYTHKHTASAERGISVMLDLVVQEVTASSNCLQHEGATLHPSAQCAVYKPGLP